jgi:hypothetical protein
VENDCTVQLVGMDMNQCLCYIGKVEDLDEADATFLAASK